MDGAARGGTSTGSPVELQVAAGEPRTGRSGAGPGVGVGVLMDDERQPLTEVDGGDLNLVGGAARGVCVQVEPDLVAPGRRAGVLVLEVAEVVGAGAVVD